MPRSLPSLGRFPFLPDRGIVPIVSIADCSGGTGGVVCSHFASRGTAHALLELVLPSMAPSK